MLSFREGVVNCVLIACLNTFKQVWEEPYSDNDAVKHSKMVYVFKGLTK